MSERRIISLYGPIQRGTHVSYPQFLKAILKISPGLGRPALRLADEIFWGKYTEAQPCYVDIEVESALDEFHRLCDAYGISATIKGDKPQLE